MGVEVGEAMGPSAGRALGGTVHQRALVGALVGATDATTLIFSLIESLMGFDLHVYAKLRASKAPAAKLVNLINESLRYLMEVDAYRHKACLMSYSESFAEDIEAVHM